MQNTRRAPQPHRNDSTKSARITVPVLLPPGKGRPTRSPPPATAPSSPSSRFGIRTPSQSSYRSVASCVPDRDADGDGIDVSFATQNWRRAIRVGEGVPPSPRRGVARSSGTSNA
ncbi:hypothetical protein GCM10010421_38080 [Streptomyces glaucus]|uniref:Secreted protein n=1 Tax=Streptomyces glaucus TaxID=284029 RepID=A0ABP5X2M1_9ACTN